MGTDILKPGRRGFLRGIPLGGAALLVALQIHPVRLAAKPLRTVPAQHDSMIAVGRAYLDQAPGEATPLRLRHLLDLADGVSALALPATEKERLSARQSEDFRTGRTVLVKGWVLSRTEARLYALASFQAEEWAVEHA
jgi:hypothetical protein